MSMGAPLNTQQGERLLSPFSPLNAESSNVYTPVKSQQQLALERV
jgi:hypothetical protein